MVQQTLRDPSKDLCCNSSNETLDIYAKINDKFIP